MQALRLSLLALISFITLIGFSFAAAPDVPPSDEVTVVRDQEHMLRAKVVSILSSSSSVVPNTDVEALYQSLTLTVLDEPLKGRTLLIEDSAFSLQEGDTVYLRYTQTKDNEEYFAIQDIDRSHGLLVLVSIFIVAVLIVGRKQGFLALVGLFFSFGIIFKILFPGILHGGNVVVIATGGALLSLLVAMYLTHGYSRLTVAAFLGCLGSVLVTLVLAMYAVSLTRLTGFASEESVFLNLATQGGIDFVALVIGGIIIGVIGVIDDVAITQASVVNELRLADPSLSTASLYAKAMNVGRDHMGAVINTLILAYTGASLPLVLLVYGGDASFVELVNRELLTTEIVRSIVGSVGLLAAVPLTTLAAVILLQKGDVNAKKHTHHHS